MIAVLLQKYPLCATLLVKNNICSRVILVYCESLLYVLYFIWIIYETAMGEKHLNSLCPKSSIFPYMCISERVQMSSYLVASSFTSVRTVGSHFPYVISANEVAQCCWICQNYCCEYFLHLTLNLGWLHPIQFLYNIWKY